MNDCPTCRGAEWVCEAHDDKAWPAECECAPGKPCVCNKATPQSNRQLHPVRRDVVAMAGEPISEGDLIYIRNHRAYRAT